VRDRPYIDGNEAPRRWSDVRADRLAEGDERALALEPWPLEELNLAQRLSCEGHSVNAIAEQLGRTPRSVRIKLEGTGYV
jgi:DNA-binding NarL/FixJ family response regulator